jgi:hypothetical protein
MRKGRFLNRSEGLYSSDLFKRGTNLRLLFLSHVPYQRDEQLPLYDRIRKMQHRTKKNDRGNQKVLFFQAYQFLENLPHKPRTPC